MLDIYKDAKMKLIINMQIKYKKEMQSHDQTSFHDIIWKRHAWINEFVKYLEYEKTYDTNMYIIHIKSKKDVEILAFASNYRT